MDHTYRRSGAPSPAVGWLDPAADGRAPVRALGRAPATPVYTCRRASPGVGPLAFRWRGRGAPFEGTPPGGVGSKGGGPQSESGPKVDLARNPAHRQEIRGVRRLRWWAAASKNHLSLVLRPPVATFRWHSAGRSRLQRWFRPVVKQTERGPAACARTGASASWTGCSTPLLRTRAGGGPTPPRRSRTAATPVYARRRASRGVSPWRRLPSGGPGGGGRGARGVGGPTSCVVRCLVGPVDARGNDAQDR